MENNVILKVEHLGKSFGSHEVLKDINFEVQERYFETTLKLSGDDELVEEFNDAYRRFIDTFKSYIYGENEENVYKCAYKLLKENKLKDIMS